MRGSTTLKNVYAQSASVDEKQVTLIEFNANSGSKYDYVGTYDGSGTLATTFSTSSGSVVGSAESYRMVKRYSPIVSGTIDSQILDLRYKDVEDRRYTQAFPVESIFGLMRPGPGIVKMAATDSTLAAPSSSVRFYTAETNTPFKYWREPIGSSNPVPGGYRHPFIKYTNSFWANKLKVTVQNYSGVPSTYSIQILPHGSTTWTTVWSQANGVFPSDGKLNIYYYSGAWTTTPSTSAIHNITQPTITNAVRLHGVRLVVTAMPAGAAAVEIIEISPRLTLNVSDAVNELSFVQSVSENDSPLPIGTVSANTGTLTVDNFGQAFDYTNSSGILYNYEPSRAVVEIFSETKIGAGSYETVRCYYGFIDDDETSSNDAMVSFSLTDSMIIPQRTDIDGLFLTKAPLSTIIRTILDIIGISGMNFLVKSSTDDKVVPFYYVDGQKAYAALVELAESYQLSMNFSSDNVFEVRSKEYMMDATRAANFSVLYADSSPNLSNIVSISANGGKPVNNLSVSYSNKFIGRSSLNSDVGKPTWSRRTQPKLSKVWESEASTLGAAPLVRTFGIADSRITIDQEASRDFNWSGYLLVDQEVVQYDAKEVHYRPNGGSYTRVWVSSAEEYNELMNNMHQDSVIYLTGSLRIPSGGRGRFSSVASDHIVDPDPEYPYGTGSMGFNSWKTNPFLTAIYKERYGGLTWKYAGGKVFNLRNQSAPPGKVVRNGSMSALRINNVTWSELSRYGATASKVSVASQQSGHWYINNTPYVSGSYRIPYRVGTGMKTIGRFNGSTQLGALGVEGVGGIGMFLTTTGTGANKRLNGWSLDVRPSVEAPENNVRIMQITGDNFTTVKAATVKINTRSSTWNPALASNDTNYHHIELAYFHGSKTFVGFVDGRQVISYTASSVTPSPWYGIYVRGESTVDFDYVWWSDRADPATIDGMTSSTSDNPTEFSIYDAKNGAAGPPVWQEDGTQKLFGTVGGSVYETMGMNEFGPVVHEVIVKRVKFDSPTLNPRPVVRVSEEFRVPVFEATPFGAEMVIVNARRRRVSLEGFSIVGYAIEGGEESISIQDLAFAGDDTAEVVLSRCQKSEAMNGTVGLQLSSELIQSTAVAKDMLKWFGSIATLDVDSVEVQVFGNPLIEPGDICTITCPDPKYVGTEKFVVTGVEQKYDSGFETNLLMRRIPV